MFAPDLAPSALKFQLEKTSPLILLLLGLFVLTSYSQQHPPPHLSFSKYYAERFVPVALERIHKAQATYAATIGNGSYGSLAQLEHAGLIDAGLGSGSKHGYLFSISTTSGGSGTFPNFIITAVPKQYKKPGLRSYAMERFGELHGADKGGEPAKIADSYIAACLMFGIANSERCSINNLRTLAAAQQAYLAGVGQGQYGSFHDLRNAGLLGNMLSQGTDWSYLFISITTAGIPGSPARFRLYAGPWTYGVTGVRSFFLDDTGVLRGADKNGEQANQNDPTIQE